MLDGAIDPPKTPKNVNKCSGAKESILRYLKIRIVFILNLFVILYAFETGKKKEKKETGRKKEKQETGRKEGSQTERGIEL